MLAMEGDRARLSVTDRPAPFRIENLGSWARLDDGDAHVNSPRNVIRTRLPAQARISPPSRPTTIWNYMRHFRRCDAASRSRTGAFPVRRRLLDAGTGLPP